MNSYDFRFFVRFMIGGLGGFAGMMVCMRYGFAAGGKNGWLVVFSILPFVTTLFFFGEVRLRPFREFRKGLRVAESSTSTCWTFPPPCGTRAKGRCRDNGPPPRYPAASLSWYVAFASQSGAISTPQPGASVTVAWPPSMA